MSEEAKFPSTSEAGFLNRFAARMSRRRAIVAGALAAFFAKSAEAASCNCLQPPACNDVCAYGGTPRNDGTQGCDCNPVPVPEYVPIIKAYPVGAIYTTTGNESPADLFGGKWTSLGNGVVLIGANSTYKLGSTGGEESHRLTTSEMPSHSHNGNTGSAYTSGGSHIHVIGNHNGNNQGFFSVSNSAISARQYAGWKMWNGRGGGDSSPTQNNFEQNLVTTYEKAAGGSSGGHSHTFSTSSVGSGYAHNNMMPFIAVNMWKRVE